jgi:hypothetical protein
MVGLARTFAHTNIANVLQYTFPVIEVQTGTYLYQGYYYGDVEFPVQPTGVNSINQILGVAAGMNSFTDQPLPAPSSFPLSIENGTGVASQVATVAQELTAKGFKIKSTSDVTPVGPVSETVVWYGGPKPPANGNWTSPAQADAQAVLAQLQGPAILGYDPANVTAGSRVTLQTGTNLSVKAKVTSPKTTTTKSTTKTTKPTSVTTTTIYDPPGVKTNPQFSAPSAVSSALEPWDPRACNAANTGPAVAATTTTSK